MRQKITNTVYEIVTSPDFKNDGICFAATQTGLYKSKDGGFSWYNVYTSLNPKKPLTTTSVVLSPNFKSDNTIFAAVGGAVLYSTDGGKNWKVKYLSSIQTFISCLAVSPNYEEDGFVIAGTLEDGVFISTNRGNDWSSHNFGLLDLNILCMDISPNFKNDKTIYIGTETGIFISKNGGKAWKETKFPAELGPVLSISISPNYKDDFTVYAGTEYYGLFISEDRGESWLRIGKNYINNNVNCILLSNHNTDDQHIIVANSNRILLSTDRGKTWNEYKTSQWHDNEVLSIAAPLGFNNNSTLLVGLSKDGIVRI